MILYVSILISEEIQDYPESRICHKSYKLKNKGLNTYPNFDYLCTKYQKNWLHRMKNEFLQTEEAIVAMLKTVYDPEIPVNVYDLGLIYKIDVDDEKNVQIDMTLTAPNCPAADFLLEDIRMKVASIEGVKNVEVNLVFEPEWDKDMMSEEAKLELGFL